MTDGIDAFETYYAEKLWQLIPEVYRHEDGLFPNPHVLREIVELIAEQAAVARRSIDRLWEDQHIETCDDWAVPYIGDLVAARLVSAQDRRARRVDVANAIRFRRRRGTPDLLDTLVRAMSGWDVVLVEGFQRLARTRHRLDPLPDKRGKFTSTPIGGTADLRSAAGAEAAAGPWSEYYHTLDTRALRGAKGQFGIRKLNFHLYTLRAYVMKGVDPFELQLGAGAPRTFTFDPSGRDVPLFINAEPSDETCGAEPEWNVTHPMRCRLLGDVSYQIHSSHLTTLAGLPNPPLLPDVNALAHALGQRYHSELAMRDRLRDFGATIVDAALPDWYGALVELALERGTGKAELYPQQLELAVAGVAVARAQLAAGDLSDATCHPDPAGGLATLMVSPEHGRLATVPPDEPEPVELDVLRYAYGFSGEVGAGPYSRNPQGVTQHTAAGGVIPNGGVLQDDGLTFDDSRTYALSIATANPVPDVRLLVSDQHRPLVRLSGDGSNPFGANLTPAGEEQSFMVDGGWFASSALNDQIPQGQAADFAFEPTAGAADPAAFDFDRVEICNATFDPGGVRGDGRRIPPLRLHVRTAIRRLVIKRCIMGPIVVEIANEDARVDELVVCESIVDATNVDDGVALSNLFGEVVLEGSTVLGDVDAATLRASNCIVTGRVRVVNNQEGCFRFSYSAPAIAGEAARLPPRFRSRVMPFSPPWFCSTRFGDPNYAQLSLVAPEWLTEGAENGSEMGAFGHLLNPIRLRSVRAKVDEYGPVGMLAQYLFDCSPQVSSTAVAGVVSPQPEPAPEVEPAQPGPVIADEPPAEDDLPTDCNHVDEVEEEPEEPEDEGVIDLSMADLNGAPPHFRVGEWRASDLPRAFSADAAHVGIPFDKVDVLVEYDARWGSPPEKQGWSQHVMGARGAFRLEPGALAFAVDGDVVGAALEARAELPKQASVQLHAYAFLQVEGRDRTMADQPKSLTRPDRTIMQLSPRDESRDPGRKPSARPVKPPKDEPDRPRASARFGLAVLGDVSPKESVGLRARYRKSQVKRREARSVASLERSQSETVFEYLTLDGSHQQQPRDVQVVDRFNDGWHSVSLQGSAASDAAVLSSAGIAQHEELSWFGTVLRKEDDASYLTARFALDFEGGASPEKQQKDEKKEKNDEAASAQQQLRGRLRNFVASHPGRFMRAWLPAVAPRANPTLALVFVFDDDRASDSARIVIRYGARKPDAPADAMPDQQLSRTLKPPEKGEDNASSLSVRLDGVDEGAGIWITIERDYASKADVYAGTLRLVEARFKARGGRK